MFFSISFLSVALSFIAKYFGIFEAFHLISTQALDKFLITTDSDLCNKVLRQKILKTTDIIIEYTYNINILFQIHLSQK